MAFEMEGFCVVRGPDVLWGGDIRRFHPPAGKFDGVIGGPPCQAFSRLAHMVRQNGYEPKFGNLIPEFERVVEAAMPNWWLMETVPDAPLPFAANTSDGIAWIPASYTPFHVHSFLLNNRWCADENGDAAKQNRTRNWTFGIIGERRPLMVETVCFENAEYEYAACGGSSQKNGLTRGTDPMRPKRNKTTGRKMSEMPFNVKSAAAAAQGLCRKQGLPESFIEHMPFRAADLCKMLGNGVPLPMGRAIAKAVREATTPKPGE